MRNVAGPRVELAPNRTIFNLLGPMSNPALVKRQLVGVFDRRWLRPVAEALGQLGLERALVVHGQDGMDEITTTTKSWAASLENGKVREIEIAPEEVGVKRAAMAELKGGDAAHNAEAIHKVLGGEKNAFRDIVVLNSAAALMVAGKAADLKQGAALAVTVDRLGQGQGCARNTEEDLRMSGDTLDKIVADKRRHVAGRISQRPLRMVEALARDNDSPRGFAKALKAAIAAGRYGLIAEIKKASPSKGLIREDFDPPALARGLRARRRHLSLDPDRRALLPGQGRVPHPGAPRHQAAGAAQGLHDRSLPGARGAGAGRRLHPADHGLPRRCAGGGAHQARAQVGHGRAGRGA